MKKMVDIIVVGFAIFSMFFGAGNLIFPPYIGMTSGSGWLVSYLGFIISDVGMILLSIIAIARAGSYQAVFRAYTYYSKNWCNNFRNKYCSIN